jgi:hypothetical protein
MEIRYRLVTPPYELTGAGLYATRVTADVYMTPEEYERSGGKIVISLADKLEGG